MSRDASRRLFLSVTSLAGAGLVWSGTVRAAPPPRSKEKSRPAEVNATEDLMREHGVIRRTLLVYEACASQLSTGIPLRADVISSAANLIRRFAENYHERLEEEQVFPRLEKAGKQGDLIRVLREQHAAGRKLTEGILKSATPAALQEAGQRQSLAGSLQSFVRMYQPHAAREDTDLFPAFHALFDEAEFHELGERFEEREHQLLGSGGFEGAVAEVAQLEKSVGIHDLAAFTVR
ncbi:hemerythrin domain-containing protein [Archangium lansingense]|uniref:Hemerythrin domain-containing protein n=1 Tax=Archangium lansingense TaxID=2995310 RepID=A0ABT4A227_9BACT|nr:hemerythrin domain-containing protein [Archangium lansinium]MCY1075705.1 hemerythrin domain-containing protein [Archangium lansinium]